METNEEILDAPDGKFVPAMADTGQRIANYIVDWIACIVILTLIDGFFIPNGNEMTFTLLVPFIILAYYIVMEYYFGRTLGKMITRTRVLNEDGSRPTFKTLAGRNLARFIPFEPFSYFGNTRGWHDRLSGTIVVKG